METFKHFFHSGEMKMEETWQLSNTHGGICYTLLVMKLMDVKLKMDYVERRVSHLEDKINQ